MDAERGGSVKFTKQPDLLAASKHGVRSTYFAEALLPAAPVRSSAAYGRDTQGSSSRSSPRRSTSRERASHRNYLASAGLGRGLLRTALTPLPSQLAAAPCRTPLGAFVSRQLGATSLATGDPRGSSDRAAPDSPLGKARQAVAAQREAQRGKFGGAFAALSGVRAVVPPGGEPPRYRSASVDVGRVGRVAEAEEAAAAEEEEEGREVEGREGMASVADVRAAVTQAVAMATEASVAMGRAAAELEAVARREDEAAAELREEKALLEAQVARLEELRVSAAAAQRDMKAAAALETAALEAAAAAATTAAEEAATPQAAAGVLSSMRLSNSRVRAAATDEGVEGGGSGSGSRDDGSDGGDGSSGGGGGSGSGDSGGDDMSSGRRQRRPVYRGVARPSCALSVSARVSLSFRASHSLRPI